MNHYFKSNEDLKHRESETVYVFGPLKFSFITDAGVFSKSGVDFASDILLRRLPELSGRVLDLGCGFGCIGIVLAKLYGEKIDVTMSDINARAVELTGKNAKKNGVNAEIVQSDGFERIPENFDGIILNPPIHAGKPAVYKLYEKARGHLNPGGSFFVVIQKKHGALSHKQELEKIFGQENCSILYSKKGFCIFELKN